VSSVTALSATLNAKCYFRNVTAPTEQAPRVRSEGRTANGRRRIRRTLTSAAIDLFLTKGYEETTVDEIAEAAGVARRTFFRYFRSKEDVIFPDHEEQLARVARFFESAGSAEPPLAVVCRAAEMVLELYLEDPEISAKRYQLTRTVPALRDREIASVHGYRTSFTRYLRDRLHGEPDGALQAEIAAAAVVAAHNHVLRHWLREGGRGDIKPRAERAFRYVQEVFSTRPRTPVGSEHEDQDEVLVAVMRTSAPMWRLLQQIENIIAEPVEPSR